MNHATVAAGLVEDLPANALRQAPRRSAFDDIVWVTGPGRASWAAAAVARLKAQGRQPILIDDAAIALFPGDDPVRTAREVALLVASAGVPALITVKVLPDEAHPGRVIDSSKNEDGGDEWVI